MIVWIALHGLNCRDGHRLEFSDNSFVGCCLNKGGLNQINTPLVLDPFKISAVENQGRFLKVV